MRRFLALTLTLALAVGTLPALAAGGDPATFRPAASPGETDAVTAVDTGIDAVALTVGADAWTCETQDISVTSASGVEYTSYLVGKANPKVDEGVGTYFSFAIDPSVSTGSLELMYRLNSGKALYILDDGQAMTGFDGLTMEVGGDTSSTIIVEGGHTYTIYAKGSKLRLYGCTFQAVDPAQVFAAEIAAFPFARIQGANADKDHVEEDLALMDSYESQFGSCDVSWTSSDAKVIDTDGSVNLQRKETAVTLTGHFQVQENRALKADVVFDVTVVADPDDASAVAAAKEALTLGDTSAVKRNMELPTTGKRGTAITWATSNKKVVDADGKVYPAADKDQSATLTATITRGSARATKAFTVTVTGMTPIVVDSWSYADADGAVRFTSVDGGKLHALNLTCNDPNPAAGDVIEITVTGADGKVKATKRLSTQEVFAGVPVGKSTAVAVDLAMDGGDSFTVSATDAKDVTPSDALTGGATIYVVGDSTASAYGDDRYPRTGWAQMLDGYFSGVKVVDLAISGRSSSSFKKDAEYTTLRQSIKAGDYLIIQFGHNDNSDDRYTDPAGDRFTDGAYKSSMLEYVELAWDKGAHPIIATSISRRRASDEGLEKYVAAARELAGELSIPCVDLYAATTEWINKVGVDAAKDMFNCVKPHDSRFTDYAGFTASEFYEKGSEDDTHLNLYGADLIAQWAADALSAMGHPLAAKRGGHQAVYPLPSYAQATSADAIQTAPWSSPDDPPAQTETPETGAPGQAETPADTPSVATRFADVPADHWASEAVEYVASQGFFNGTDADHFSPSVPMSRAMMVTVLHRLSGVQSDAVVPFPDVPQGQWYTQAVSWAAASGIANGYDTGAFGPDDPITREQLAMMIYRYAQAVSAVSENRNGERLEYTDAASISAWSAGAMGWMMTHGILTGKPGNLADPSGLATRAEVATVLQRLVPVLLGR